VSYLMNVFAQFRCVTGVRDVAGAAPIRQAARGIK
jgi:hypothetical protein